MLHRSRARESGPYCVRRGSNVRDLKVSPRLRGVRRVVFLPLMVMTGLATGPAAQGQMLAAAMPSEQHPPLPASPAGEPATALSGVQTDGTLEATAKRTRFVIGIDKRVQHTVFSLSKPNRVIVELGNARLDLPNVIGDHPIGLIKSFRGGISAPGRQRVIIEVTAPVVVEQHKLTKAADGPGYQLTLDISPVSTALISARSAALDAAPSKLGFQPPLPRPAETPDTRAARAFKPIIVIDPGHGGHDSGASKFGTVEKDVVLAFSNVLREKLEQSGRYKILMTRETDVFVELDARRAFAERHNASLFIAVHADYASTRARGATIYTLRDGVAERLKRTTADEAADQVLSKEEVGAVKPAAGDMGAVKNILADLARREINVTKERTSIFARSVVARMSTSTNMRDDPDKQAAFRVLKTAQFPSVLIELAYVSNRKDAALLNSNEWRRKVAGSICDAVDNYFGQQLARLPL
jgi:N-acetylmuramoyl-L-alanine amidase